MLMTTQSVRFGKTYHIAGPSLNENIRVALKLEEAFEQHHIPVDSTISIETNKVLVLAGPSLAQFKNAGEGNACKVLRKLLDKAVTLTVGAGEKLFMPSGTPFDLQREVRNNRTKTKH